MGAGAIGAVPILLAVILYRLGMGIVPCAFIAPCLPLINGVFFWSYPEDDSSAARVKGTAVGLVLVFVAALLFLAYIPGSGSWW